jgi:ABC-type Fe3+ transport system permease subunit
MDKRSESIERPNWPALSDERRERILRWTFWVIFLVAVTSHVACNLMFTSIAR